MRIHYLKADWHSQKDQLQSLRLKVFVGEQKVPQELEQDGKDESAHHYIALNEAGQLLGCGRLLADGQIGRMAVLPEQRNRGVGRKILDLILEDAVEMGLPEVFLLAQTQAIDFYTGAGFVPVGEEFQEAGIPHQKMTLLLPVKFEGDESSRQRSIVNPDVSQEDTERSDLAFFDSEYDCQALLYTLMRSARRTLCIYSPFLDHALFDTHSCESILSEFARSSKECRIRILIHDSIPMVQLGHRLQALSHRLSGHFDIRKVQSEYRLPKQSFLITDRSGIWVMPDYTSYTGFADPYQPVEAQRLQLQFDRCWDHSRMDPELRLLEI